MRAVIFVAALCGLLLVAAAAAGAHLLGALASPNTPYSDLPDRFDVEELKRSWERAVQFGLLHVSAALLTTALQPASRLRLAAGWAFLLGIVLFSGIQLIDLSADAGRMGAPPILKALGALVPVGGICLMAGWALLAASALVSRPKRDQA